MDCSNPKFIYQFEWQNDLFHIAKVALSAANTINLTKDIHQKKVYLDIFKQQIEVLKLAYQTIPSHFLKEREIYEKFLHRAKYIEIAFNENPYLEKTSEKQIEYYNMLINTFKSIKTPEFY